MKKYAHSLFILVAVVLPGLLVAQDDSKAKRPENIGVSDFDSFKNNSYDLLDESSKLKVDATRIDTDVKSYSAGIASVSVEKLKADYKALRDIGKSSKEVSARTGDLDDQGKELLVSAKTISPRTKSPVATSNTNKSIKVLDATRKNLGVVATLVQDNTKLLTEELNKRGEPFDED